MHSSKGMVFSSLVVAFLAISSNGRPQATNTPAPGVETGQKIGTIIKTAISTAAPGLEQILNLIWSHSTDSNKDKATKADLQQAAKSSDVQNTAKLQMQAAAQAAVKPVGKVSDELAVIEKFLGPSVTATQDLIVIRTKAAESTTDWQAISNSWELAKTQINDLKSVPDSDLNKIRDFYLRDKLAQIRNSNETTVVSINQEITQKNLPDLKSDVATLQATLANMTAVAGYELADLQADISDLAAWARANQGASNASAPENGIFKKFLDANTR